MEGKAKKITKKVILYVILILLAIIWVIPMFTLVATAIKSKGDFYSGISLFSMPESIAWDNFVNAITHLSFRSFIHNEINILILL